MNATIVRRVINTERARVYRALVDPEKVARWMAPPGMSMTVHEFDPREGGRLRISLAYNDRSTPGKTFENVDTYHGRFDKLVPDSLIVETIKFETSDPGMQGESTISMELSEESSGTLTSVAHTNLPPDLTAADNELGWQLSLDLLAALVEDRPAQPA